MISHRWLRRRPPGRLPAALCRLFALYALTLCAGCANGGGYASHWDGRRGYDGNGDYGYDLAASRSEARSYRARAQRSYPAPGTPDDPWGPYIQDAAQRFHVPERWIREVMRQESGGRLQASDGSLTTSGAGAMGLMQVMPGTYDMLRRQYGLGPDPYEPHDNIMAGTAYIRDMYAIYGAPAFLAAYNAGPDRLDAYLNGGVPLPDETVNYVASIAPRLGTEVAMTGPLAVYAGSGGGAPVPATYYAGPPQVVPVADVTEVPADPADRAFEGGGLVTADAPTGVYTQAAAAPRPAVQSAAVPSRAVAVAAPIAAPFAAVPVAAAAAARPIGQSGDWAIQVGAFPDPARTRATLALARQRAGDVVAAAQPAVIPVQHGGTLYRGRLTGLTASGADAACRRLSAQGMDCFAVPPGF